MRAGSVGILVFSVLFTAGAARASAQVSDTAAGRSRAAAKGDSTKKKAPTSTTRIPIKKEKPKPAPLATRIPPRVDTVMVHRVDTLRLVRVDTVFRVDTVNNCLGGFIPQDWVIPPVPIIPGSTVPPIGTSTTPEPSSLALVASGLAGLVLLTRRKK